MSSNGGTTLSLTGVLDFASAETLTVEIAKAPIDDGAALTIDLTEVEFIDSTGIALLVSALNRNETGTRVSFVPSESPAVARVLELTGLAERLPLAEA
jgi:anti-sigma B factor antagonist